MLVQMGFGTFIVGLAPIFWDLARTYAITFFLLGLAIILHTLYTDSKRTNRITAGLQDQIDNLKKELADLKKEAPAKDTIST